MADEKIIISCTTFKKRINTIALTLFSILKNTVKPDKIVLVLSEEEFPEKENELPENLMLLVDNGLVEILWVYKNIFQFKKIYYTLQKYPDDVIISIDDDMIYPSDFINLMYADYLSYGKKYPITGGHWIDVGYYSNKPSHHGSFSLVKQSFFGDKLQKVFDGLVLPNIKRTIFFDDPVYTYAIMANGLEYKMGTFNGSKYKKSFRVDGISNHDSEHRNMEHHLLRQYFGIV